jgi:taurine--2-oxoglutarate transaminase
VKALDPYRYRCPFCRAQPACTLTCADALEAVVLGEGAHTVAAVLVEPITGLSGFVVPPDGYLRRLREICDRYEILLISDEVITGFCRTGRFFGCQLWDVEPDILTFAKGVTCGYVPLGGAVVSERVAAHFDSNYLGGGLTYAAHPLACAAGCAVLEVYIEDGLAERAERMGSLLMRRLGELEARHPSVGEVRGRGLLACIELVRDRATREPLTPQRTEGPLTPAMAEVRKAILERRTSPLFRWNLVGLTPPLTISEEELDEGLAGIEAGLEVADRHVAAAV